MLILQLVWNYVRAGQQPPLGRVRSSTGPAFGHSQHRKLFLFLSRHGIFLEVFTMGYRCSLHPISALSNLVKISLKVQKLSREGGGEQMDERGVDRQHDLIIPAGIGIQARNILGQNIVHLNFSFWKNKPLMRSKFSFVKTINWFLEQRLNSLPLQTCYKQVFRISYSLFPHPTTAPCASVFAFAAPYGSLCFSLIHFFLGCARSKCN